MSKPLISYPWHRAPKWAKWAAVIVLGNGPRAVWYCRKPVGVDGVWLPIDGIARFIRKKTTQLMPIEKAVLDGLINWRTTLQPRPEGEVVP